MASKSERTTGLQGVKLGDVVVVVGVESLKPMRLEVTKVGRVYVTVGELRFVRDTGEWDAIGFGDQKHAYTEEEWAAR
jgi:hypothetical protein